MALTTELDGATREIEPCSDLANAEYLLRCHAPRIRHVTTWGTLLAWDGARWLNDASAVARLAADAAQLRLASASEALREAREALAAVQALEAEDPRRLEAEGRFASAKKAKAWAQSSQSAARIRAALDLARASEHVCVHHEQLDADPRLLGVANGTLDLRSGALRSPSASDLLTLRTSVPYAADARCPTWDRFLSRAMGEGAPELVPFLQRLAGYCLTGETSEQCLAFFYGTGANGKSTFVLTLLALLGEYGAPAPRTLLYRRDKGADHPTEIASLYRLRLTPLSELDRGQVLDEAKIKELTGGDRLTARRMNQDFWSFRPTHKIIMSGNHKPTIHGTDDGIWRRLLTVPWSVRIPDGERDPDLPRKLLDELPGILAWAVAGCRQWQDRGLDPPASVREATADYRDESDPLGDWIRGYLVTDPWARTTRVQLRTSLEAYYDDLGQRPPFPRVLAERLRAIGARPCSVRADGKVRDGWAGVRLATDQERWAQADDDAAQ